MTKAEVPDLIHLADELGNSLVLRVHTLDPEGLTGEIEVRSSWFSGQMKTWVTVEDLQEWETVLDDLGEGDNTAWREAKRAPEIWLELDDEDRLNISVIDTQASLATAELVIAAPDDWLDDHYDRLDAINRLRSA